MVNLSKYTMSMQSGSNGTDTSVIQLQQEDESVNERSVIHIINDNSSVTGSDITYTTLANKKSGDYTRSFLHLNKHES